MIYDNETRRGSIFFDAATLRCASTALSLCLSLSLFVHISVSTARTPFRCWHLRLHLNWICALLALSMSRQVGKGRGEAGTVPRPMPTMKYNLSAFNELRCKEAHNC